MDIYQILLTHNRQWSTAERLCFGIVVMLTGIFLLRCVRRHKIKEAQAAAAFVLLLYLGIVFGSTVFTRTATIRRYELIPFWSWKEVVVSHDWALLQENLLNCILLFPMGILLPMMFNRRIRTRTSFFMGVLISAAIELCQLIFMRGLFEWDDMIHNGLGCMLGSVIGNIILKKLSKLFK
ncbi:MAG: VanZ family protein [Eubacteriales bacterium]|nr:VanZ family protein [Eubacteriales bacterium]